MHFTLQAKLGIILHLWKVETIEGVVEACASIAEGW